MKRILSILYKHIDILLLLGIICLAIWLRLTTANTDIILDYDPWFWYRHAKEILENNFLPLKWDSLSFFPPGRPTDYQLGWSYTLAIFYAIAKVFISSITLMKFSIYFVAIFAGICAIPAYLLGRMVTNKWGGLVTAFFATVTPTFLSVSMAGYPDNDITDVFYTFLVVLTTLYAIEKFKGFKSIKSWFAIGLVLAAYWLFAFNWGDSWYIFYIFIAFIPFFVLFKIIEGVINRKEKIVVNQLIVQKIKESKNLILVIVAIGILGFILTFITSGWPFNTLTPLQQLINGIEFLSGKALIVNISVAELQTLNIFSRDGFLAVAGRIGIFPFMFALIGLPCITIYKLIRGKKITAAEYFAIIWLIVSFWLITRGIRFSLIFSLAVAAASGFVVGNLVEFFKGKRNLFILSTVYGLILFGLLWHASDNLMISQNSGGMEVDQNWRDALDWLKNNANKNALVATWWDPGHIIAGYAGLRVHADGAHCPPDSCVPYNHNIRIQDMGKIFATSSEDESVSILKKYQQLTPDQCQRVKQEFDGIVPKDACDKIPEIYLITSSDLIGKYYWLSFFGTKEGKNYFQLSFTGFDQSNLPTYGGIVTLLQKDDKIMAVMNIPQQGIRNAVVREIVYFDQTGEKHYDFSNFTNTIDGMVWVDPSFRIVIFMPPEIRNSIFTKLFFFNGQGLSKFQLVFNNPEVKIFKVIF